MRLFLALLLALSLPAWATINGVNSSRVVVPSSDGKRYGQYPAGDYVAVPPRAPYFIGAFESGVIQAQASINDGYRINVMNSTTAVCTGNGGAGPSSGYDARVSATGASIGADTVSPRAGTYFWYGSINNTTNYTSLCGNGSNKPRWNLFLSDAVHRVDFDQEVWLGFSIYLPSDFVHDVATKGEASGIQWMSVHSLPSGSLKEMFMVSTWVPSGGTTSHWYLILHTSATTISSSSANKEYIDLGDVVTDSDLGRWTDFVIRFRINPFTASTNASTITGGKNQTYPANKGIMQVWKASGTSSPNRAMTLVVNRTNTPVGLVPNSGYQLQVSPRHYKYGWHNNPTTSTADIDAGFDEFRMACVDDAVSSNACDTYANTTGVDGAYIYVHPTGQAAP